jgi:WD40 repeat protein
MARLIIWAAAGQGKVVASLDVDHSGSRVLAGSRDYTIRLFDFNGMKSDLRSFRQLEPFEGHPVHAVSWSPTGKQLQNRQLHLRTFHTSHHLVGKCCCVLKLSGWKY